MGDADEVKSKLNIVDIIGEKVTLKKAGRNFKGLCPFHNEKTPSFMVSPDRQVFHCFGCGKGGSIIDFFMEYHHMEFPEALEELAEKAGVVLTKHQGDRKERKFKDLLYEVNQLASEFYTFVLTKHPLGEKALLYLKNRGITDKSIHTFSLGYSPNSWDGLYRFLHKKHIEDEVIEKAGLAIKGTRGLYDRFRGRVMFTLRDHRGKVVGFSGRVLDPTVKEAKYINTSETPIYSKSNVLYGLDITHDAIVKEQAAILMEGEIDVISSFQAGISNVVAIKGSALTEGHAHLLKRYTERLIFALDSDSAGDKAARRGIEIGELAGLDIRVAIMPVGKDPDEAVREDVGAVKKAMHQAVPIYDYLLQSVQKRFDTQTAFGKKKASEEVLPVLAKIENSIVQGHYIKKVAQTFGVSEEVVIDGVRKVKEPLIQQLQKDNTQQEESFAISAPERLELYFLGLLLQGDTKELCGQIQNDIPINSFKHMGVRRVLEALFLYIKQDISFVIAEFANTLPKELLPVLDEAYLWDISAFVDDTEDFLKEWHKIVKDLKKSILRRKMREITEEMKGKNDEQLRTLQEKLVELTKTFISLEKSS